MRCLPRDLLNRGADRLGQVFVFWAVHRLLESYGQPTEGRADLDNVSVWPVPEEMISVFNAGVCERAKE
jgi:hypothetical protein